MVSLRIQVDNLRVLWFAKDSPHLSSAYGKIADELVLKRLRKHYKMALFATVGYDFGCLESEGVTMYPRLQELNGEDILLQHYNDFNADLYVTATDIWIFKKLPILAKQGRITWVSWAFIDYEPTKREVDILSSALKVVPTSKWLEGKLKDLKLENVSKPIFLGIDHQFYRPWIGDVDSDGKEITKGRLKATLGFPEDSFLILMVQMNQLYRKPFEEQFHGIQIFRNNNPDVDVRVYCHSLPRLRDGYSLPELALEYGLDYQKHDIRFADQYTLFKGVYGYSENRMAKIYNAADVLLNATSGESPGLPVLEAQSCGLPVIGTDYTTYREFIHAGYCAKVLRYFHSPTLPWIKKAIPDPDSIAEAMEKIVNSDPNRWLKTGPEAMKEYTWENCLDGWLQLLSEAESLIERRCLKIPTPSAELQKIASEVMILT